MATRVIRPKTQGFDFAARERELSAAAPAQIKTWRLANQSRRFLAALTGELSNDLEIPEATRHEDLTAEQARRMAVVGLGQVAVRAAGSAITLVGAGYEPEAFGPVRTLLEAYLRCRQVSDDPSGSAARGVLKGQPHRSIKHLAGKHGDRREVEILDHFAHADILALGVLDVAQRAGDREVLREIRPRRGVMAPTSLLLGVADDCMRIAVSEVEVFSYGVDIPRWISAELLRHRENPPPPGA